MVARQRSRQSQWFQFARRGFIVGCLVLLQAPPAQSAEDDAGLWATLALSGELAGPVRGNLMVQPRFADDIGELERFVVRPSVSIELPRSVTVALGYDAHLIDNPRNATEHRIWQQVALDVPLGSLGLHHRLRLEERLLEDVSGVACRLRYRLRAAHPIGRSAFEAVVSNEVFVNLNSRRRGPQSGFGEDRAFAGLRYRLTKTTALEGGYQLQYVDRPRRDAANHVLMIGFSATLR